MLPFGVDPHKDTICDVIRRWAEIQADAPILVAEGRVPLTYGGLVKLMDEIKVALNRSGLGLGDRVSIIHGGGAGAAAAFLTVIDCTAAVPLNPAYTEAEFIGHYRDRKVDAVLIEEGLETAARAAAEQASLPVLELKTGPGPAAGAIHIEVIEGEAVRGKAVRNGGRAGPDDLLMVLATSGTTSASKVVPLKHRHLLARALAVQTQYELNAEDRCLSLMPLYYSAQARWACVPYTGGSIIFLPRFTPQDFFRIVRTVAPTWYTGSYTFHNTIAEHVEGFAEDIAAAKLRFAAASSGRLDPGVAEDLEAKLGVPLIESYASSETGYLTGNPRPPGQRKHGTVGPTLLAEVRIRAQDGAILDKGERGEVMVRSAQVFEGYEGDTTANAESFVDGWFRTGDEGLFDEDGYLTLTGRIKEMINRGGEKVSPAEVDAALMSHDEVREAVAFPVPHPTLGEEVAAAVVRAPGSTLSEGALTRYLLEKLAGFKVPRRIVFVDQIPRSDAAKIQRNRLVEKLRADLGPAPFQADAAERSATPLEAKLQGIWQRVLKLPHVGLHDNFFLLGGDSLLAVELFLRIEEALGQRLPTACLFAAGTVLEMAELIERQETQGCMVAIRDKGTKPPFFCVHGFGGEAITFYETARHLGSDQPFYGIQALGWDGRTVPFTKTADMAAHYIAEIRKIQPKGPYYLGGYSFGGRVAVFMAKMLKDAGEEVGLLVLIDPVSLFGTMHLKLRDWLDHEEAKGAASVAFQTGRFVYFKLRRAIIDHILFPLARAVLFPVWEYHRKTQKPLPRFLRRPDLANRLMRAEQRSMPSHRGSALYLQALKADIPRQSAELDSWKQIVKGNLSVVPLDCTHYEIVREPHAFALTQALRPALSAAYDAAEPSYSKQPPG